MAIAPKEPSIQDSTVPPPRKRTKAPGVRVIGGRIYDSEHGKTCHQCRQKTMDFFASCKDTRLGKPCPICFCHKCLLNRYGEKAEEMAASENWSCPKCRGICNCSFCMKKRGHPPTGILVHAAKKTGFSSVLELLHHKGSEEVLDAENIANDMNVSLNNSPVSNKGLVSSKRRLDVRNSHVEQNNPKPLTVGDEKKEKKNPSKKLKKERGSGNAFECSKSDAKQEKGKLLRKASKGNLKRTEVLPDVDEQKLPVAVNDGGAETKPPKVCKLKKCVIDNALGRKAAGVTKEKENSEEKVKAIEKHVLPDGDKKRFVAGEKCGDAEVRPLQSVKKVKENSKEKVNAIEKQVLPDCDKKRFIAGKNSDDLEVKPLQSVGKEKGNSKEEVNTIKEHVLADGDKKRFVAGENCGDAEVNPLQSACKSPKHASDDALECNDIDAMQDKENLQGNMSKLSSVTEEVLPNGYKTKVLVNENIGNAEAKPLPKVCKPRKHVIESVNEPDNADIVSPQGTALTMVAGVELPAEDIGPSLQFLEFCAVFAKVLGLKKGQSEYVLRELAQGRVGRRGFNTAIVQFHIKLLSLIQKDLGEGSLSNSTSSGGSWLQALGKCITGSQCALKGFPLDFCNEGPAGYDNLGLSEKLRVLNFLCDEALGTEKLRNWIDKENAKYVERRKEANEKVLAAKRKEKDLKQKLKDGVAKAMLSLRGGAPISVSEHDKLISKIRAETEKARSKLLDSKELLPKKKQRSDAVRTDPILLEGNGRAYWRLKGSLNSSNIMLQDIGNLDLVQPQDKWFMYETDQEEVVERHISYLRNKRLRVHRNFVVDILKNDEESSKCESLSNSASPLMDISGTGSLASD